jgi:hypothetical protein
MPARDPLIGGQIDESPERSVRMGVRGGPGRTRTRYQTVMSRRINDLGLRAIPRGSAASFPVQCRRGNRAGRAMAVKVLPICSLRRRLLAYSQITY